MSPVSEIFGFCKTPSQQSMDAVVSLAMEDLLSVHCTAEITLGATDENRSTYYVLDYLTVPAAL